MASEKKSPFDRPEQTTRKVLGPDADQWIAKGNAQTPNPAAHQAAPEVQLEVTSGSDQAEKSSTKPEVMKRLTIDIPESLHKRVKSQCGARGTTIADVVRKYLEKSFPDQDRKKPLEERS